MHALSQFADILQKTHACDRSNSRGLKEHFGNTGSRCHKGNVVTQWA